MASSQAEVVLDRLSQAMQLAGLDSWPTHHTGFSGAYVRRRWLFQSTIVFLVSELNADHIDPIDVDHLLRKAKQWCDQSLGLSRLLRLFSKTSLNLVLLHKRQMPRSYIQGKIDKSGLHFTLLQSITSIDIEHDSVAQEKSWADHGTAREAILRASMVVQ